MKIKPLFILFGTLTLGAATQASAADGCKFMLCMGAVNPMGISECAPTVKEVLHDLRKGKSFPICRMSDGRDSRQSGSYVDYARATLTPRCPKGTKQGQDGVVYHVGTMPPNIRKSPFAGGYTNLPSGASNQFIDNDNNLFASSKDRYSQRICVSGAETASLPATTKRVGDDYEIVPPQKWYQSMQVMKPDGASYEFNFFVDGSLYSTHRF